MALVARIFQNISILVLIAVTLCLEYEIQVLCPNCKWWLVKLVLEFPLRQQSSSVVNPSRFCIYSFIISLLQIRVTRLMQTRFLALEVPRPHVKAVKTALESKDLRNRELKISRTPSSNTEKTCEEAYFIPTLIEIDEREAEEQNKGKVFQDLGINHLADCIHMATYGNPQSCETVSSKK